MSRLVLLDDLGRRLAGGRRPHPHPHHLGPAGERRPDMGARLELEEVDLVAMISLSTQLKTSRQGMKETEK
jgi:hypothetical protein